MAQTQPQPNFSKIVSHRHENGTWWHIRSNLCVFSVLHCVEVAFGAASGGTPQMKMGPHDINSKMVVVVFGSFLVNGFHVLYFFLVLKPLTRSGQSRCLGWTHINCLVARNLVLNFPLFLEDFQRRPLILIKRPQFIDSPVCD